jgi:hypothetical protein
MDARDEVLAVATIDLRSELSSGESLLWSGRPSRKVIFHSRDWYLIPFSLMWGGFAIFWEIGASGGLSRHGFGDLGFFTLWGIPFVVIGQYLIWGRFFYDTYRKSQIVYGITNQRVLVLFRGSSKRVSDRYWGGMTSVSISERKDGIGTIDFDSGASYSPSNSFFSSRNSRAMWSAIDPARLAFVDIADARSVYQIVQTHRQKQSAN